MTFTEFFSHPLWFQLGLTLVHFLWQGLAIALFIWGAVRLYELRHGTARYNTYMLGLILMIIAPLVTFSLLYQAEVGGSEVTTKKRLDIGFSSPLGGGYRREGDPMGLAIEVPQHPKPISGWQLMIKVGFASWQHRIHLSIPWLLPVWISGVVILSLRLLLGYGQLYVWRVHASSLPDDLWLRTQRLARRFGYRHFISIYCSQHAHEAMAMGILRPVILLPASWISRMDPDMLEAIIAHELSHLRRYDLWINLVQRTMETLFFYHPAVWWLSKGIRQEREYCCDQYAADVIAGRATYASALHHAGQLKLWATNTMAMGLGAHSDTLLSRVRHVLGIPGTEMHRTHWLAGIVSLVVMALFVVPPALTWDQHASNESMLMDSDHGDVLNRLTRGSQLYSSNLNAVLVSGRNDLDHRPADPELLAICGIASYHLQRLNAAEAYLTRALLVCTDPSRLRIKCLFFLGKTYQDDNQGRRAVSQFKACLHLNQAVDCLTDTQRSEACNGL